MIIYISSELLFSFTSDNARIIQKICTSINELKKKNIHLLAKSKTRKKDVIFHIPSYIKYCLTKPTYYFYCNRRSRMRPIIHNIPSIIKKSFSGRAY